MASKEGTRNLRQPRKRSATVSMTRKAKPNEFLEEEPVIYKTKKNNQSSKSHQFKLNQLLA